jgi:MFS family permease
MTNVPAAPGGAGSAALRSPVFAALGGLLFGFDTAVISGTTEDLRRVFGLGDGALGFTVAAALIGTILGALVAGPPADRWGRRNTLVVIAVLYFASAVGSAFPFDWYSFLSCRFLGGIGVGAASVACPLYITEITAQSGGHAFAFYAACMVGQLVWVLTIMPETKGRPLEQIQQELTVR